MDLKEKLSLSYRRKAIGIGKATCFALAVGKRYN